MVSPSSPSPRTEPLPLLAIPPQATVGQGSGMRVGVMLGLLSALAFSSSGPFAKPLLEAGWSLGATLVLRMGLAAMVLTPWLVRALVREPALLRRHGAVMVALGLTGMAGCQLFYFAALQRMPVAIALLVQYLAPVMVVGYAWLRTRVRPSALVVTGSLLAMTGLVLVVDVAGAQFDLTGTLLALGAAVCAAAYFLLLDRASDDLPPLALASAGLWVGAALIGVLVLTGALPFHAPAVEVLLAGIGVPSWLAIVWIACGATTLGYALGVLAVPRIGARVASFVGLAEVLFALLFAWLLLGETPTIVQTLGGTLIIAGVVAVRADAAEEPGPDVRPMPAQPVPEAVARDAEGSLP